MSDWIKAGSSVLARWSDGLTYVALIRKVNLDKRACWVEFEDRSTDWIPFKDLHKQLPEDMDEDIDILCRICDDGTSIEPNQIVICDICNQGYHQKCHSPPIDDSTLEPDITWVCRICIFTLACAKGGAEKKGSNADKLRRLKMSLPYDLGALTWDWDHRVNIEETYCYCGSTGRFHQKMLQCNKCCQWFHEACLQCLNNTDGILYSDHYYQFNCAVCSGGEEHLKRIIMKWPDMISIVLTNLMIEHGRRWFMLVEIVTFIRRAASRLKISDQIPELSIKELTARTTKILKDHPERFVMMRSADSWTLNVNYPLVVPFVFAPPGVVTGRCGLPPINGGSTHQEESTGDSSECDMQIVTPEDSSARPSAAKSRGPKISSVRATKGTASGGTTTSRKATKGATRKRPLNTKNNEAATASDSQPTKPKRPKSKSGTSRSNSSNSSHSSVALEDFNKQRLRRLKASKRTPSVTSSNGDPERHKDRPQASVLDGMQIDELIPQAKEIDPTKNPFIEEEEEEEDLNCEPVQSSSSQSVTITGKSGKVKGGSGSEGKQSRIEQIARNIAQKVLEKEIQAGPGSTTPPLVVADNSDSGGGGGVTGMCAESTDSKDSKDSKKHSTSEATNTKKKNVTGSASATATSTSLDEEGPSAEEIAREQAEMDATLAQLDRLPSEPDLPVPPFNIPFDPNTTFENITEPHSQSGESEALNIVPKSTGDLLFGSSASSKSTNQPPSTTEDVMTSSTSSTT